MSLLAQSHTYNGSKKEDKQICRINSNKKWIRFFKFEGKELSTTKYMKKKHKEICIQIQNGKNFESQTWKYEGRLKMLFIVLCVWIWDIEFIIYYKNDWNPRTDRFYIQNIDRIHQNIQQNCYTQRQNKCVPKQGLLELLIQQ